MKRLFNKNTKKLIAIILMISILWIAAGFLSDNFKFLSGNKPPKINSLVPDFADNQSAGSIIRWTAMAYDPENDELLYKFQLKGPSTNDAWQPATEWNNSNSWTWTTTKDDVGENQIKVQVRDGNHSGINEFDDEKVMDFTIKGLLPIISGLNPSRSSPQVAGTEISWIADANDPLGGRVSYRFSVSGSSTDNRRVFMTNWTTDNRWTWKTAPSDIGTYQIYAEIRSERSIEPEAYKVVSFTLTNEPPESPSLESDKNSPQPYGSVITWKAITSDPNRDTIYHRFLIKGPSNDFKWEVVQDWNTDNTWVWEPTSASMGENTIKVQVTDEYPRDKDMFDAEGESEFTIIEPQQRQANLTQPFSTQKSVDNPEAKEPSQTHTYSNPASISDNSHTKIQRSSSEQVSASPRSNYQVGEPESRETIKLGGDERHNRMINIGGYYSQKPLELN